MSKPIVVLQKGVLNRTPHKILTRSEFILSRAKYGFMDIVPFAPVDGVSMAVECYSRQYNFTLDSKQINGLVMFFTGDKTTVKALTEKHQNAVMEFFSQWEVM